MSPIPRGADDFDQSWLNAVFPEAVTEGANIISAERIGVGAGVMSDVWRVRLTCDAGRLPDSVIVKLPATLPESREAAEAFGSYAAECRFYSTVAAQLPVRTPTCFANVWDERSRDFMLVLEDFGEWRQVNPGAGLNADDFEAGMRTLALLHGSAGSALLQTGSATGRTLTAGAEVAAHDFKDVLHAGLRIAGMELSPLCEQVLRRFLESPLLPAFSDGRPDALVHTDFRPDNVFFANRMPGRTGEPTEVAVIDWQDYCVGHGGFDLALWMLHLTTDKQSSDQEDAGILAYCETLANETGQQVVPRHVLESAWAHMPNALYIPALVLALGQQQELRLDGAVNVMRRAVAQLEANIDNVLHTRPELAGNPGELTSC